MYVFQVKITNENCIKITIKTLPVYRSESLDLSLGIAISKEINLSSFKK